MIAFIFLSRMYTSPKDNSSPDIQLNFVKISERAAALMGKLPLLQMNSLLHSDQ
jgi:hypothetical protein